MQALFTLTSSESKRLLGKAIAAMPEVQQAKQNGYLVITRGSTNGFILEELLQSPVEKEKYVAGQVIQGVLCVLGPGQRTRPVTFHKGEVQNVEPNAVIDKMVPGDVLIKGANAVDPFGNVGVIMAGQGGGTMGQFYTALKAQGVTTLYAVGLEKLIPSVEEAARCGGKMMLGRTIGCRNGMLCVADGQVVTEIEAIETLFDLEAIHYASGGWGGAEGSVTLVVEGEEGEVNRCVDFIEGIKGEPPLKPVKDACKGCGAPCSFSGKELDELPAYLR